MKMQSAVEEYLVEIEVRKYTPKTIRSYRCNLNLFLRFCAEKLHVETVQRRLQRNENRSCCGSLHSRICSENGCYRQKGSSGAGPAAVDDNIVAGHVGVFLTGHEDDGCIQFVVAAVALHRAPAVDEIRKPALTDRRLFGSKEAGTEGVDRDAVLRPLVGQLAGEIDNCALRCGVF